jgi:hypothetical protein
MLYSFLRVLGIIYKGVCCNFISGGRRLQICFIIRNIGLKAAEGFLFVKDRKECLKW